MRKRTAVVPLSVLAAAAGLAGGAQATASRTLILRRPLAAGQSEVSSTMRRGAFT
jgi:hypothetical protein